jgi:hypothetical protein
MAFARKLHPHGARRSVRVWFSSVDRLRLSNAPNNPAPTTITTIKQRLTRLACSTSPQNKVLAAARFGFVNGAVRGVIAGATGGAFFEGVGAIPGAIIGGFVGGVAGTAGGIITGGATAGVCSIAGVY